MMLRATGELKKIDDQKNFKEIIEEILKEKEIKPFATLKDNIEYLKENFKNDYLIINSDDIGYVYRILDLEIIHIESVQTQEYFISVDLEAFKEKIIKFKAEYDDSKVNLPDLLSMIAS